MARSAFWSVGASVLAAALLGPPAVSAQDDGAEPLIRAFRMAGGGSHLGVSLSDLSSDDRTRLKLSDERGALVKDVQPDTPAAKAGLKAEDVIVRFDGETVRSAAQLSRLVRETPAGRPVTIEVSRGGAIQRLSVRLDEGRGFNILGEDGNMHIDVPPIPPAPAIPPIPPVPPVEPFVREGMDRLRQNFFIERPGRLGITYQELSGQLARYFKVADGSLLVSDVAADAPAGKAGLRAGDVIVQVNGKPVSHGQDLREQVAKAEAGSQLTLGVQRDGKPLDVNVTVGERARARARKPI
jgi:membrane-associated protease RseP (regulator of RpoE activity)